MRLLAAAGVIIVLVFLIVPQWLVFQHNDWVGVMSALGFFGAGIGVSMATYAIMELRRR